MNHYQQFNDRRNNLLSLLDQSCNACAILGQDTQNGHLRKLYTKVTSDQFKVMVLGTFKNGKSTFINALLGEAVLPAFAIPCTAVINEVKWGEEKTALLYFRDPLPDPLPNGLSPRSAAHIQESQGRIPPPMTIPVEELEAFVAISDPDRPQDEAVADSPYDKAEIFWPLELCRNGVEIIDSPGLNEHGIREKVTVNYLAQADAILFVMSSIAFASQTEIQFVEMNLHNSGHREIFFICNRFDQIDTDKDRERVKSFATKKLGHLTDLKPEGIFFLSARQALDGRIKGNPDLLERSGIMPLEDALSSFLVNDRGRLKLLAPARELTHVLLQLRQDIIPGQRRLLGMETEDVVRKVNEILPKLADARREKGQMLSTMGYHFDLLHRDIRDASERFLNDLAVQIPPIVESTESTTKIKTFTLEQKKQVEEMVKELIEKLDLELQKRVKAWQDAVLEPMLKQSADKLQIEMKVAVDQFYQRLHLIKDELLGGTKEASGVIEDPSSTERFFATALGFVLGDIGSAAYGARFGFKGLGTAIAVQFGLVAVLMIGFGIVNPFVLLPIILASSFGNALWAAGLMENKIKKRVGEELQTKFKASIADKVAQIIATVQQKTDEVRSKAGEVLERNIQSIQEQANSALRDKQAGEQVVEAKREKLEGVETQLKAIALDLNQFIDALTPGTEDARTVSS
jgi:GTPase SAR1 family protein